MKRFGLYHPGDETVAVVPCVGPHLQPGWFYLGVRLGALAIGEAQLTGRSRALLPAGRRPYRNHMPVDPRKPRSHNIWCRPKVWPLDVVVKFFARSAVGRPP